MPPVADDLARANRELSKELTGAFWLVGFILTCLLLVAYPPTVALGATAGIAIAVVLGILVSAYIVRLWILGTRLQERELFIAGLGVTLSLALDQWLSGGFRSPIFIIFFLHVFGCATVLDRPQRVPQLLLANAAVAAPLIYDHFTLALAALVFVFNTILLIESALLGWFAQDLRAQHAALAEAERAASLQAVTDALTGLGNRRALTARLEDSMERANTGRPVTIIYLDLDGFKSYNDQFGHGAGDALLQRLGHRLAERVGERGAAFRIGGDEFCALIEGTTTPDVVREMEAALSEQGSGFSVAPSFGLVHLPQDARDPETALRVADQRMYANKRASRLPPEEEMSQLLLRVLAEREPGQFDGAAIGSLAGAIAERLGVLPLDLEAIVKAAELHDIGKVAIPEAMLRKQGPLNDEEWSLMREHPVIGERMLADAPSLNAAGKLIRGSHERWDGGGYPDGLAGRDIPLGARIVAVCDAFAAMVSDRPFRAAMTEEEALSELRRCAGSQFDPDVVAALVAVKSARRSDDNGSSPRKLGREARHPAA